MTEVRPPDSEGFAVSDLPDSYEDAFASLYKRAYSVSYKLCGRRTEAEDAAQEAMARAYLHWDSINGYAEAWVVRVASNCTIGSWRKTRRVINLVEEEARMTTAGPDGTRIDLVRALRRLPRRQREVVTLRYLADLPEAEVARALECTPGTVKQHASRGLAALRASLGPSRVEGAEDS